MNNVVLRSGDREWVLARDLWVAVCCHGRKWVRLTPPTEYFLATYAQVHMAAGSHIVLATTQAVIAALMLWMKTSPVLVIFALLAVPLARWAMAVGAARWFKARTMDSIELDVQLASQHPDHPVPPAA